MILAILSWILLTFLGLLILELDIRRHYNAKPIRDKLFFIIVILYLLFAPIGFLCSIAHYINGYLEKKYGFSPKL